MFWSSLVPGMGLQGASSTRAGEQPSKQGLRNVWINTLISLCAPGGSLLLKTELSRPRLEYWENTKDNDLTCLVKGGDKT